MLGAFFDKYYNIKYFVRYILKNKSQAVLLLTVSYLTKVLPYTSSRPKLSKAKRSGEIS